MSEKVFNVTPLTTTVRTYVAVNPTSSDENLAGLGWAHLEKVARIGRGHSSLAGDSPPEHFEPNWRSEAASAI